MKIHKNNVSFIVSFVVLLLFFFLSLLNDAPLITLFGTILQAIPLIVFIYYVNSADRFYRVVITASSYATALISQTLSYLVESGFPLFQSLIASVSSTLYLIPLIVLIEENEKKRLLPVLITAVAIAVTYCTGKETIGTSMYLYSRVENYQSFIFYSRLSFILTSLVPLSELIFRTKNNYLSDLLLALSTMTLLLKDRAQGNADSLLSPSLLLGILILLIYNARTGETFDCGERRKIVFSTLRFQEIEPLRKKRKPRVYEIPPNVPVKESDEPSK